MLDILNCVGQYIGTKKLSKHLVIRGGMVTAFNGESVSSLQVPVAIDFAPLGKAFVRAVKKCGEGIQLWINPEGNVLVHGDNGVTVEVPCAPLEKFPMQIQTGFWFNEPKPRKPTKEKCQPPEPVWLRPDYLPGLEQAKEFKPNLFTLAELTDAVTHAEPLIVDCEVYANYFLVAFVSLVSGKVYYYEKGCNIEGPGEEGQDLDWYGDSTGNPGLELVEWILTKGLLIDFNGTSFDITILTLLLSGKTCAELKWFSDKLITEQVRHWQLLKSAKVKRLKINHIDLIEVLPLDGSLKLYGGRLHVPKMQDIPFHPNTVLSDDQILITRFYCINSDCTNTAFAFMAVKEQIKLREVMGERYGMDLRSKSDAQIAGTVIKSELQRLTFAEPERVSIVPGTRYKYNTPKFVSFQTPLLTRILETIQAWDFTVDVNGYIALPIDPATGKEWDLKVQIADGLYTIGMGGLHSNEKVICHNADADTVILDRDVASYYPAIILELGLYPSHLGEAFLQVFKSIVKDRLDAKKAKDKIKAEMLKIVVNGTFGMTSSKWSFMYAPDITMTVTITGQLCLLMLIEALELQGFKVCSANTDGIVFKCPKDRRHISDEIFKAWEMATGFVTEETEYKAIYSRDVNNYIAIKTDGKTKCKGAYLNPWALQNPGDAYDRLKKNPHGVISIEAAISFLTTGKPLHETVNECQDIKKFVAIRTVRGGAVQNGQYIGKAVRWYYAKGETGCFIYVLSGKMVAETTGARPCMILPVECPADLDRSYYILKAEEILREIGAQPPLIDAG